MDELSRLGELIETNKQLIGDYTAESDRINILLSDNHNKIEMLEGQINNTNNRIFNIVSGIIHS